MELVQLLLEKGADVVPTKEIRRGRGMNVYADYYANLLKEAELGGNEEIYKLLESKGAI